MPLIPSNRIRKIQRTFHRLPARTTIRLVPGDPLGHLRIKRLRRRYINQIAICALSKPLCKATFS